ncbi:MAG: LysR family transcriptional regulator [Pyramidobacter sp.]|nr:LysR family transcriptional regulator [Pyramidobacter sp.]
MEQGMEYIWRVYQEGSFSKAAEKLFMTQPALSIAVRRVESALGAELFDRSRHPLELTEAGRAYVSAIRRIRGTEEDLARQIDDLRGLRAGHLRIGGTHYLNSYLLADVLAGFTALYPHVQADLTEAGSPGLIELLRRRELDLTFSCDPKALSEFEHLPLFCDHVLLAVPVDVPLPAELNGARLTASDILAGRHLGQDCPRAPLELFGECSFILLGEGNNLRERSLRMLDEAGIRPKIKMTLSQLVTAYAMADNGLGAAFVCDRLVRAASSRLSFFRLGSPLATREFHILISERNYTPFAVRAFADYAPARIRESDLAHGRDWGKLH